MEESPTDVVTHKRERGRLRKERTDIDCKQFISKHDAKLPGTRPLCCFVILVKSPLSE